MRYHRLIFETNKSESVITLRTWVIQESEFQTIASETVRGLMGNLGNDSPAKPTAKYKHQRTFFRDAKDSRNVHKSPCKVCGVWNCAELIKLNVTDRWNIAKQFQLCFRCLPDGHHGKSCPRSRQCDQNDCQELHHRLFHKPEANRPQIHLSDDTQVKHAGSNTMKVSTQESASLPAERVFFRHGGEGTKRNDHDDPRSYKSGVYRTTNRSCDSKE